jgi:hypothetical protein
LLFGSVPAALAAPGTVTIAWTAPGDDSTMGRATSYDLRYSTAPITAGNFTLATKVTGMPAPQIAGSAESFPVTNLSAGTGYYFAIKTSDDAGNTSALSNVVYYSVGTTAVRAGLTLWLSAPYPNPARATASWSYTLPQPGPLVIDAFDLAGRHVRSIARGWHAAGQGQEAWDLRDDNAQSVAPGVYMVRCTLGTETTVKRLVVAR